MQRVTRGDVSLLGRWIVARVRTTLRTPRAAFFTFVFPLVLLSLLNATNKDNTVTAFGGQVDFAQYFTPAIGIWGLATGCYALTIFGFTTARDRGVLKRVRGTPLNPWIYLTAWLVGSMLAGAASLLLLFVVAVPAFGVHIYASQLPAAVVTATLGAACLSALGLAVASFVRRAETAPTLANLTLFPLSFLSGVFFPIATAPDWVRSIAHVFPLSHLVDAFGACFSPPTTGSGFEPGNLAVIAAWGIAGLFVAIHRFSRETDANEEAAHRPVLRRRAHEGAVSQ